MCIRDRTRTVEMHAQLVGYDFKKKGLPSDKNIAVENSKVSNDYFWKTNEYTDKDVFGRTLDLTALDVYKRQDPLQLRGWMPV